MPFRKFFGGRADNPEPNPPEEELEEDSAEELSPESESTAEEIDAEWARRAAAVIPGGSSTGSKQPAVMFGTDMPNVPTYFQGAHGCVLHSAGGSELIDCTMALGAVALGYADEGVGQAVMQAVAHGNVAGMPHVIEVEVAERLCEVIPCAESVRFFKGGADAVTAAVRVARVATGRKKIVCSGYLGWHDWSNTGLGIPGGATADVLRVPFDNVAALEAAVSSCGDDLAAIVLEPVVEHLPSAEWLETARRRATAAGAVLVFDEMKTGFRLATGGYQAVCGITPDLATFGKALANGFPLAALVGTRDVMAAASRSWITGTLAGEATSLAAAGAVLTRYEEEDVCARLSEIGATMRASVEQALRAAGMPGVSVDGLDAMWFLRFDDADLETNFLQQSARCGVLLKRGAYNFASLAHGEEEWLIELERRVSTACVDVMEAEG